MSYNETLQQHNDLLQGVTATQAEQGADLQTLLSRVLTLPTAPDPTKLVLPELRKPANTEHILAGYEAIDQSGNKLTGTLVINSEGDNSGSGDSSGPATCTISYVPGSSGWGEVYYPTPNGYVQDYWNEGYSFSGVTCGSFVLFTNLAWSGWTVEGSSGVELVFADSSTAVVYIPATPGADVEIGLN